MEDLRKTATYPAHVYVIGLKDGERELPYTKVGISGCVSSRARSIATSIPFEVFVHSTAKFSTRPAALSAESRAHERLNNLHVRGEWFAGPPSLHFHKIREIIPHIERTSDAKIKLEEAALKPKKLFKYEERMIVNGIRNNQARRIRRGDWLPKYPSIPKEDLQ